MILNKLDESTDAKFKQFFNDKIAPDLDYLEKYRISTLNKFLICSLIGIPIILACYCSIPWLCRYGNEYFRLDNPLLILLFEVLLVIFSIFCIKSVYHFPILYKNKMKKSLLNNLLKFYGDFGFSDEELDFSQLVSYHLFSSYSACHNADTIVGEYNRIKIKIVELILSRTALSTSPEYLYEGLLCTFYLNKKYNSHTLILRNSDIRSVPSNFTNLQTNNAEFDSKFKVLTDNYSEANSILTPKFINGLLELTEKFQTNVRCCFYGGNLLVSIETNKGFFEPTGIFESLLNYENHKKILIEMNSIFSIADKLGLTD